MNRFREWLQWQLCTFGLHQWGPATRGLEVVRGWPTTLAGTRYWPRREITFRRCAHCGERKNVQ